MILQEINIYSTFDYSGKHGRKCGQGNCIKYSTQSCIQYGLQTVVDCAPLILLIFALNSVEDEKGS